MQLLRVADAPASPPPAPVFVQVQQPVQLAAAQKSVGPRADADPMTMLPFALGTLAAALLAAGAIIFASGARRRQQTVVRIIDLNAKPRLPKAPRLAGWSDLSDRVHDEESAGEERRLVPARRRQAA